MTDQVFSFIASQGMISPGDHVICALSGGKDSMALLHVLLSLKNRLDFTLSAAHLNHQLRGEESLRDENFVRAQCEALDVPLTVERQDVAAFAKNHKLGLEEAARQVRYNFLTGLAEGAKIATAHTADDNLETFLIHLIRGSGLRGLGGIQPVRDNIIRPLLTVERRELEDYLERHGIPHVEDSSNATDFCLRNRLRHHVLPLLLRENPALSGNVSALCLSLLEESQFLMDKAREVYNEICVQSALSLPALLLQPKNMQLRVLQLLCGDVPQLQRTHLEAALTLCTSQSPSGTQNLPGGYVLRREYDLLRLTRNVQETLPQTVILPKEGTCQFGAYQIHCQEVTCPEVLSEAQIALKSPDTEPFFITSRQAGDKIRLSGGTKKLSRYLIDKKIPAHLRDTLPVVRWDDTVAAVLPLAADIRFRANPGENSLILTVTRLEEVK